MNLVAQVAPLFVLATIVELLIDRIRGSGFYRGNDAINSLSTGMIYLTLGYFTKFLSLVIWGFVLAHFAVVEMPMSWFGASPAGISLWILAALGWDFCYYWNHRFNHEISVLWAGHAVHHQSEDYNLSTAQRQGATGFIFGWVFYLPLFVIGFPLEVLLTVGAINLIYQFWVHTQVIHKLGVLDRIFVTPSNHRVHHAQNERYIDKNYGGIFILWDRLFGTFAEEDDDEPVIFGVRKPLANWNPFWANLQVYDYLLFDAIRAKRWRDKLGVWFRRTGWRPADVAEQFPKPPSDLSAFRKFDPDIGVGMRRYVLLQFMVAIVETLVILQIVATAGAGNALLPCLVLWAHLYTLGLLNEGRSVAVRLELIRLLLINAVLVWLAPYAGFSVSATGWIMLVAYTAVSAGAVFALNKPYKTELSESLLK
jgi:sterol desaturase/sphingolipid hydroxylase (fatty acid hydroxylase superfamily)